MHCNTKWCLNVSVKMQTNNATCESDKKTCHNQSITSDFFLFCSLSNYLLCQKQLLKDNPLQTTLLSYAILQLFFSFKKSLTSRIAYLYFRIFLPNKTLSFCWRERYRRQTILFAAPSKATLGKKKVATTSKPPFLFLKLRFQTNHQILSLVPDFRWLPDITFYRVISTPTIYLSPLDNEILFFFEKERNMEFSVCGFVCQSCFFG